MKRKNISVIIPAYNEEESISKVINDLPKDTLNEIIVVNNGSTDNTSFVAEESGATVIDSPEKGYGNACLTGIEYLSKKNVQPDIVVFIDGDYSDYPEQLCEIVNPILEGKADFVIGSRAIGKRSRGAMSLHQVVGNKLATTLLHWIYGVKYTDLGPFRAILFPALMDLGMKDRNYGWTIEMQLKAAREKLRSLEVPVNYRKRIGKSKVSGTIKGSILAGYKIIFTIFRYI